MLSDALTQAGVHSNRMNTWTYSKKKTAGQRPNLFGSFPLFTDDDDDDDNQDLAVTDGGLHYG